MAIRLLDQHTAELIAAGEVVERPASVVKELVENAIDAGATSIQVEIARGGTELISVSDNGSGINAAEIPLAFLRHATSKVQTKEDLDSIQTLGFRGEALASIASVAKVQLLTATAQDEFASLYGIEGGQERGLQAAARPVGTTIRVENLFYNTPARMKFLKKDASEGGYVNEIITRLALSNPQISFRFIRDGKMIIQTPGDRQLETVVYAVLGAEFAKQLYPVNSEQLPYTVSGLVTSPLASRASRSMQFFYINGRFVKNRTMMAALEQAYRGMSMHGKFPGCVLFLHMPPDLVDVNVHPAKTEVRFARDGDIFGAVYKAVKAVLMETTDTHRHMAFPEPPQKQKVQQSAQVLASSAALQLPESLRTGVVPVPVAPTPEHAGGVFGNNHTADSLRSSSSFIPYRTIGQRTEESGLDVTYIEFSGGTPDQSAPSASSATFPLPVPEQTRLEPEEAQRVSLRFIGEIFKTYILAQAGETLCVIDKHAAHERLLYEKLIATREETAAQQLLCPLTVTLSAAEKDALLQNAETLLHAGVEVEDFGAGSVLVRSVPADIDTGNVSDLIIELAARLSVNAKDAVSEKQQWVLHSIACRAAIKAGDNTPPDQLLALANEILSGEIPPFCPHGRPVVLEITRKELEKQFGRLG